MSYTHPEAIMDGEWLEQHLDDPTLRIVDASWYLPASGRNGRAEYAQHHIPGAVFFDIDAIARTDINLPHMLPEPAAFAAAVGALGIADHHRIVIYDGQGIYAAPRAWWMFRACGHDAVTVLAGGLPQWQRERRPVTAAASKHEHTDYTARPRPALVASCDDVRAALQQDSAAVLDARAPARFAGSEPEPRPGVRPGHMPGAGNLPYAAVLDPAGESYLPAERLRAVFADHGVTPDRPVITSCGSGITACILSLGLHLVGHGDWRTYDGSWAEWGSRPDTPIATGDDAD